MASETEVKKEMEQEFPSINGQFLTDCVKMGAFLSLGEIAYSSLEPLEFIMFSVIDEQLNNTAKTEISDDRKRYNAIVASYQAYLGDKNQYFNNLEDFVIRHRKININPFKHALTQALGRVEAQCNYPNQTDENGHPRYYYVGFLKSKDAFLDNIAKGTHWKDVGASPEHGEHTHRLQWALVAMHRKMNIENRAGQVFMEVGKFRDEAPQADAFGQKDLWPRLFDRPKTVRKGHACAESENDFRCPENMNLFLIKNTNARNKLPLLSTYLETRYNKRATAFQVDDAFPGVDKMRGYYARKRFNKDYGQLGNEDKLLIDQAVGNSGESNQYIKYTK